MFACTTTQNVTTENCQVKDPAITGEYEGKCKKGLAHGYGVAKGEFTYKGEFVKGYPEGKGELTFEDGSKYTGEFLHGKMHGKGELVSASGGLLTGYWKNGKHLGDDIVKFQGYEVIKDINFDTPPIFKKRGNENKIRFEITGNRAINSFNLQEYSSGNLNSINETLGSIKAEVINVTFPFSGKITYKVANKSGNFYNEVLLQFVIYDKGEWVISTIHN